MPRDGFYNFIAFSAALSCSEDSYNSFYDDMYFSMHENIMGYSFSLIEEIDELLENGLTKEEIESIIRENDFVAKDPELTKEEGEFLREYSLKMLNIRHKLYNDDSNRDIILAREKNKKELEP